MTYMYFKDRNISPNSKQAKLVLCLLNLYVYTLSKHKHWKEMIIRYICNLEHLY